MIKAAEKNGVPIVNITVGERKYSFVNKCSHFGCDLTKGSLHGHSLICICGWQYDLNTGRAMNHPMAELERVT
jgi:nitrite reductase/ring-hydroxylating ferredoxin subunit